MENASKALIIAGAILLAILIIGLGMMVFTQARNAIENTGIDQQKVTAYNSEFTAYEGTNVSGTNVRSLIDAVRNHNVKNKDDDSMQIAIMDGESAVTSLSTYKSNIKSGKTYTVIIDEKNGYDSNTGYVKAITITENK